MEDKKWHIYSCELIVNGNPVNDTSGNNNKNLFTDKLSAGKWRKVEEYAADIMEAYIASNYTTIYSSLSSSLKMKGGEEEFYDYLEFTKKKYGKMVKPEMSSVESSKDGKEYKITYLVYSPKNNKQIEIVIWIRLEAEMRVSGIKFVEYRW